MASIEDRVTALEAEQAALRERVTDTHTLAAHADHDVAEFRDEIRAHTRLLNATRLDMIQLRETETAHFNELKAGVGQLANMLQTLIDRDQ